MVEEKIENYQDESPFDCALNNYNRLRRKYWNEVAHYPDNRRGARACYHSRLAEIYQFLVTPGQRVLEVGCGGGELLAALKPAFGVGVDFSPKTIAYASQRYPNLHFVEADAHNLEVLNNYADQPFDVVIMSDLLNDVWDVQTVLEKVGPLVDEHTRIIINSYSRLWELPLGLAEKLNLARPVLYQNWLTVEDLTGLLELSGYNKIRSWPEILLPLPIPFLASLANRWLVKLPFFRNFGLTNFIVAQRNQFSRSAKTENDKQPPSVSVIVPARNEAGNIEQIFARVPTMGSGTELIFVEGHSRDETYAKIEQHIAQNPDRHAKLFRQTGAGKGDAVRLGFAEATGDILMILDADLTVPPEDLPRFYQAIVSGKGEFINGVRLVYPMENGAMRFANLLGNKFFSLAFSTLLGQSIKDTLCGTKVLWRRDYERIAEGRAYFGDFDPFGDFDLLFGAAKLNLKIMEIPVRYRERKYGETNIQRWSHGWLLLKMVLFASARIKFV